MTERYKLWDRDDDPGVKRFLDPHFRDFQNALKTLWTPKKNTETHLTQGFGGCLHQSKMWRNAMEGAGYIRPLLEPARLAQPARATDQSGSGRARTRVQPRQTVNRCSTAGRGRSFVFSSGKATPWATQDNPGYPSIGFLDWDNPG